MIQRLSKLILVCGCLLVANGLLQWLVDSDLGICWTHNTLRNWDQAGFLALKGRLVTNPGGHNALEQPHVYSGHRAASLYPAFVMRRLFAWTGLNALPFHALFTLVFLGAIWHLLGRTEAAFSIGAVAILSPGYVLYPTTLDPNAIAVLTGIPFAALLGWQLLQPRLTPSATVLLLVATIAFTLLNWTTAFVHMQIFLALLLTRMVSWRRLALYALFGLLSASVVVGVSLASKISDNGRQTGSIMQLLAGYTWGQSGYNIFGLSTTTFVVRMGFINILGLLPLWILWGWILYSKREAGSLRMVLAITPVGLAVLQAMLMRNYFGHHPWMAAPLLLLGIVMSLFVLLRPGMESAVQLPTIGMGCRSLVWVATFVFAFVVLLFYREHQATIISLVSLVRSNSARGDGILVVRGVDTNTADIAERLPDSLDRWLMVEDDLPTPVRPTAASFLLSAKPLPGEWTLAAQSQHDPLESMPFMRPALDWFSKHIAHRAAGDRLEVAEIYYLYHVPTNLIAAAQKAGQTASLPSQKYEPR